MQRQTGTVRPGALGQETGCVGTVRPGAYVPDLGHRPRSPVPFAHGRLAYKQNSIIRGRRENQLPLIGRRGSLRSGTTDRGKCPKSGTRSPGQFVPG